MIDDKIDVEIINVYSINIFFHTILVFYSLALISSNSGGRVLSEDLQTHFHPTHSPLAFL